MTKPTPNRRGYIPTLDGWRAIAIAGVVLTHAPALGHPFNRLYPVQIRGWMGVFLFFAISGLLICSRMIDEEERFGSISLRNFYIRRALRILPAALFYLLVIAALGAFHVVPFDLTSWFGALFFYRNYLHAFQGADAHNWFTSQFWSLSIEEHFYFILPSIFFFLPVLRKRALAALVLACYAWLAVVLYVPSARPAGVLWSQRTEFSLPFLLIPALYALVLKNPVYVQSVRRFLTPLAGLVCAAVVVAGYTVPLPPSLAILPSIATAALFPLLLLSTIHHPGHLLSRALELPPLKFIGRLSYSIYLWQQLFFTREFRYPAYPIRYLERPWINLLCLLACALVSFYAVEKPCIRLGHKWGSRRTPLAEPDRLQGKSQTKP